MLRATLIGGLAALMWATLALLTTFVREVPPFQLVGMAFAIAALLAVGKWILFGEDPRSHLRQRPAVWLVGVGGLFGFHFFYFVALRHAPPVEANLINYSWPLLIVLFSAFLPGERLRWWHMAGAMMGLAGSALLLSGPGVAFRPEHTLGYAAALCSAVIWAGYSVVNRRFGHVPTDAVGGFCAATSLLALFAHLAFEETRWPDDGTAWITLLLLGLGPVGSAFFLWDYGTKHGDIRALGAASYGTPLLSTVMLILAGLGRPTVEILVACALITGGAALAARELFTGSTKTPAPATRIRQS